jgi:hypothetical protein
MDIAVVRAEALRKIGRNVVNFSKIETAFKYLLSVNQFEGTEPISEERLRDSKKTLGSLVREVSESILGDANQPESELTADSSRTRISFSFKVTYSNADSLEEQKLALSSIVAERNKLIHQDLAFLDTSSVKSCQELISLLDEQNSRLLAHLEELRWIIKSLGEGLVSLADFAESPDFLQRLESYRTNI